MPFSFCFPFTKYHNFVPRSLCLRAYYLESYSILELYTYAERMQHVPLTVDTFLFRVRIELSLLLRVQLTFRLDTLYSFIVYHLALPYIRFTAVSS